MYTEMKCGKWSPNSSGWVCLGQLNVKPCLQEGAQRFTFQSTGQVNPPHRHTKVQSTRARVCVFQLELSYSCIVSGFSTPFLSTLSVSCCINYGLHLL